MECLRLGRVAKMSECEMKIEINYKHTGISSVFLLLKIEYRYERWLFYVL